MRVSTRRTARSTPRLVLVAGAGALALALAGCGSETADDAAPAASESASESAPASESASAEVTDEPSQEPSEEPAGPATVSDASFTLTAEEFTAVLEVEDLTESGGRVRVVYEWAKRNGYVLLDSEIEDGEPQVSGVWVDNQVENSGRIDAEDLDVAWDLDAGTVTITLRDKLMGEQAAVAAFALEKGATPPRTPPKGAITADVTAG